MVSDPQKILEMLKFCQKVYLITIWCVLCDIYIYRCQLFFYIFSFYILGNLFGGSSTKPFNTEHKTPLETLSTRLFDENLKFGSMPTHPLGTSTVFHAGVIGQGKRKAKPLAIVNETTKEKGLMFVSILFKLCDEVTIMPKDETYKQLAILLVDLVSPDVMYNGLPWPEEEFTR